MNKSVIALAPFSGLFLEIQEDLWFLGIGKMMLKRGSDLPKVTQQDGGKARNKIQGANPELLVLPTRLPGVPPLGKVTVASSGQGAGCLYPGWRVLLPQIFACYPEILEVAIGGVIPLVLGFGFGLQRGSLF